MMGLGAGIILFNKNKSVGIPKKNVDQASKKLDRFSIVLSLACLIHCSSIPVFFFLGGYLSSVLFLTEHLFHEIAFILAIPISLFSLINGYKLHLQRWVLATGLLGLALMGLGLLFHAVLSMEIVLTIAGSCLMVVAHGRNLSLLTAR